MKKIAILCALLALCSCATQRFSDNLRSYIGKTRGELEAHFGKPKDVYSKDGYTYLGYEGVTSSQWSDGYHCVFDFTLKDGRVIGAGFQGNYCKA